MVILPAFAQSFHYVFLPETSEGCERWVTNLTGQGGFRVRGDEGRLYHLLLQTRCLLVKMFVTLRLISQFGLGLTMDHRRGEFSVLDLSTTCFMNLHNCTEGVTISLWYKVNGLHDPYMHDLDDGAVLFSFRETDTSTETYLAVLANDGGILYVIPSILHCSLQQTKM